MKKILGNIVGYSIGLACDAALIHNFFYKDRWNKYCENYITLFKVFSWVIAVAMFISLISLFIAVANTEYLRKSERHMRDLVEANGRFFSRIWYFVNSIPMLIFVWVFVGNVGLGVVWGICALLQPILWEVSKKVKEKLPTIDDPGLRLADLLKGSYPNN